MSQLQTNITNLQAILDSVNNLPEAITLPTLSNPGTSTDLLSGKQLIDGDGNIVEGSIEVQTFTDNNITRYNGIISIPAGYYSESEYQMSTPAVGPTIVNSDMTLTAYADSSGWWSDSISIPVPGDYHEDLTTTLSADNPSITITQGYVANDSTINFSLPTCTVNITSGDATITYVGFTFVDSSTNTIDTNSAATDMDSFTATDCILCGSLLVVAAKEASTLTANDNCELLYAQGTSTNSVMATIKITAPAGGTANIVLT